MSLLPILYIVYTSGVVARPVSLLNNSSSKAGGSNAFSHGLREDVQVSKEVIWHPLPNSQLNTPSSSNTTIYKKPFRVS